LLTAVGASVLTVMMLTYALERRSRLLCSPSPAVASSRASTVPRRGLAVGVVEPIWALIAVQRDTARRDFQAPESLAESVTRW